MKETGGGSDGHSRRLPAEHLSRGFEGLGRVDVEACAGSDLDVDDFDAWWVLAHVELGGDDFGESFNVQEGVFQRILMSNDDLEIAATESHLSIQTIPAR